MAAAAAEDSIPVSSDVLADLLHTVNLFRSAELDVDLGWTKLKPFLTDLLFNAGYHYEPMNNMFIGPATGPQASSCGFSTGVVSDHSWLRTTQLDGNQTIADRNWCNVVNTFDCSTSSSFVEGKKPWSAGDTSSALSMGLWSTEYCGIKTDNVTSSVERDLIQVNGDRIDVMTEMPDSTSTDVAVSSNKESRCDGVRLEYLGSNGSIDSNGFGSSRGLEPWKATRAWPALESDDESSNPLNIASAEEEDVSSITEEVTVFESPSAFSKKRSASAEMMSSSQLGAEPCRKRRAVSISRSKSLQQGRDEKDAEVDAADSHLTESDVNSCKRTLRPKDRLERSRVVTRKTFCFRYKYSSSFSSKFCMEETGKRSVSESDAASKSNISVPNGIKLKNCFIRLNRVKTEDEESQPAENNSASDVELHDSTPLAPKEVQSTCSTPLTLKDEDSICYASPTFKEEQSTGSALPTVGEARSCTPSLLKEAVKPEADEREQEEGLVIKEEAVPAAEEKVVQCVCDGCGEIVPDCSWLTAHIVTCAGRPESGVTDAMMDDDLTNTFQSDAPIWDAMGGSGGAVNDGTLDTNAPASDTNGDGNGGMLSMETTNEIGRFASSQSPADVDASNLMQQLMQNRDNQSSFIYDPSMTSETAAGVKVIQMSDGTSFSMSTQPSVVNDAPEDHCGKEVLYNGVLMYEFTEYQCDLCLLTFASHSATAEHIRSSDHSGSTISRNSFCCCLKCSIRYREKHIMWHHILYLCGNTADETADESRLYRCLLCCKAFLSAAFLRRHVCLQHGRQALAAGTGHRPLVESSSDGIVRQLAGAPSGLNEAPQVVSRLTDYGVGLDGQLLGTWNCFQVNEGGAGVTASMAQDDSGVFSVPGQETADTNMKTKVGDRNGATGTSNSANGESGADSQALLDLACSIVLGGCSPPSTNFTTDGASAPPSTSHPTAPAAPAAAAATAATPNQSNSASTATTSNASSRRTAKGIMYKNVFMQCIVNYLCSTCKKDLSTKASKKEHKSSPCFDADSKRFTYLRQYSYLCPYCSEKFPSQKFCRQHQLSVCLQLMGVKTDELNHKQLLCPFCDRKYFNIITLKGHMTLIHKVNKLESSQILGTSGLLEELISFAPDAAGLSEKAKKAKQQTTAEEDRKHAAANKLNPPVPIETMAPKKAEVPVKGIFPAEKKSEGDLKVETDLENKAKQCGGNFGSSQKPSDELDLENGTSHDSGLESNIAEVTQTMESDGGGGAKDVDRCELRIVEAADPDGLIFDGDASDTSTDDPSELDELSCETDNTLPTNDLKESQIEEAEQVLDGKKSLKRKKSNKKTRRKVVTKTRKKLH